MSAMYLCSCCHKAIRFRTTMLGGMRSWGKAMFTLVVVLSGLHFCFAFDETSTLWISQHNFILSLIKAARTLFDSSGSRHMLSKESSVDYFNILSSWTNYAYNICFFVIYESLLYFTRSQSRFCLTTTYVWLAWCFPVDKEEKKKKQHVYRRTFLSFLVLVSLQASPLLLYTSVVNSL